MITNQLIVLAIAFSVCVLLALLFTSVWGFISGCVASCITLVALFEAGWYADYFANEVVAELRQCVVLKQCPIGESKAHLFADRVQWEFIMFFQKNKYATVVSVWIRDFCSMFFRPQYALHMLAN